jgi:PKHD-type hydroxylase
MLLRIDNVLTEAQVAYALKSLEGADWVDGRVTAGPQSALAKRNLQVPEGSPVAEALGAVVLEALRANPTFVSAVLPLKVFPPLFNRYDEGMGFDAHIDNAIRFSKAARFRTDVSATLFLSDPAAYDGGELCIQDGYGEREIKLPAGSMLVYPATTLHRVRTVTRGSRWASFFWVQSMVRDQYDRSLLFQMDQSIQALNVKLSAEDPDVIALTGAYHNLLRLWADA